MRDSAATFTILPIREADRHNAQIDGAEQRDLKEHLLDVGVAYRRSRCRHSSSVVGDPQWEELNGRTGRAEGDDHQKQTIAYTARSLLSTAFTRERRRCLSGVGRTPPPWGMIMAMD